MSEQEIGRVTLPIDATTLIDVLTALNVAGATVRYLGRGALVIEAPLPAQPPLPLGKHTGGPVGRADDTAGL